MAAEGLSWIQKKKQGLWVVPGRFWLDPGSGVDLAVISHAHADHFPPGCDTVYATPPTLSLALARYSSRAGKKRNSIPFHQPFSLNGVQVTFIPAGHVLGSAQILLEYQGETALYSGDFYRGPLPFCQPLELPGQKIDLLISESTFGKKEAHADPEASLRDLITQANGRPILAGTYVMGKAQRLTRLVHDFFPEMKIFIHKEMLPYHRIYARAGFDPGTYSLYRRGEAKAAKGKFIYLVPPRILSSYARDIFHYKVMASGWEKFLVLPTLDGHFDLSDHADAQQILQYIEEIRPAQVGFVHGYPEDLISACQAMKIPAFSLEKVKFPPSNL
ncbi:MAG: exonuclease [Bacteroidia bacterium]|nr:exonuclease [Bacteroidia bacterium]